MVGQAELAAVLDAARNAYEAVVIDTGPLFDAAMLAALDQTDRLLLVCNPEVTSLKNVRIGLETIDRLGFDRDRVSLVANRVGAAGCLGRTEIEQALDTTIAYELPDDPAVPAAVNRAVPVVARRREAASSHARSRDARSSDVVHSSPRRDRAERRSAASFCEADDEPDRSQRPLPDQRRVGARRAPAGRPRLGAAHARRIRTPS